MPNAPPPQALGAPSGRPSWKSFLDIFREHPGWKSRPWMILGKGPSLERFDQYLSQVGGSEVSLLGLNEVCSQIPTTLTHITDLDVVENLGDLLPRRGGLVLLPAYPHLNFRPDPAWGLTRLLQEDPPEHVTTSATLALLRHQGRLYRYRSSRSGGFQGHPECGPTVTVKKFSAVPALHLLCLAGVRQIYSLGLDGGRNYARAFARYTPLGNGQKSFDGQFSEMRKILQKFPAVRYQPLSHSSSEVEHDRAASGRGRLPEPGGATAG